LFVLHRERENEGEKKDTEVGASQRVGMRCYAEQFLKDKKITNKGDKQVRKKIYAR